ncbi:hypothetical protein VTH82DRAFT_7942 [Thermothelomyces myriococcoides]
MTTIGFRRSASLGQAGSAEQRKEPEGGSVRDIAQLLSTTLPDFALVSAHSHFCSPVRYCEIQDATAGDGQYHALPLGPGNWHPA